MILKIVLSSEAGDVVERVRAVIYPVLTTHYAGKVNGVCCRYLLSFKRRSLEVWSTPAYLVLVSELFIIRTILWIRGL